MDDKNPTRELFETLAAIHKIDFLIIEEMKGQGFVNFKAPYMTRAFIQEVEKHRPVAICIQYFHGKGLIHWLAWKLRNK